MQTRCLLRVVCPQLTARSNSVASASADRHSSSSSVVIGILFLSCAVTPTDPPLKGVVGSVIGVLVITVIARVIALPAVLLVA